MSKKSMTALVSAYSRAFHYLNNNVCIFSDNKAYDILSAEEYAVISSQMTQGIRFFNESFVGDEKQALRWVVDNQLSPTPLARGAFIENALNYSISFGVKQYIVLGAGYDTFAYRQNKLHNSIKIFEVDTEEMLSDKKQRTKKFGEVKNLNYVSCDFEKESIVSKLCQCPNFDKNSLSFCSMAGLTYYLTKEAFKLLLKSLCEIIPAKSSIAFDYPDQDMYTEKASLRAKKQLMLSQEANEHFKAGYSMGEMEMLLGEHDFLGYEHLCPQEITDNFFDKYNVANEGHSMKAFENVNYCLAVKR